MTTFTWKPIYIELGQKILGYRDRQAELLGWLREMKTDRIPTIGLNDQQEKGKWNELTEIDPFTFFGNFNRGIKFTHRVDILRRLKKRMSLTSPLPQDFAGVPVVPLQASWFFPFAYDRPSDVISTLWKFAQDVVEQEPAALRQELFEHCLAISKIGMAKLTMGMFWLRPDRYLALDQWNRDYLMSRLNVPPGLVKDKSLKNYLHLLDVVREKAGSNLAEVSEKAYSAGHESDLDPTALDEGFRRYLEELARDRGYSNAGSLVERIKAPGEGGENEISNRTIHQKELGKLLRGGNYSAEAVLAALRRLWALSSQQDVIRLGAFFKSGHAVDDIRALIDEAGDVPLEARINDFIDSAASHGYRPKEGESRPSVAQLASVLLSSVQPDSIADFRRRRWNDLYKAITQTDSNFLNGDDYGQLVVRAGAFAAQLARTPTFQKYFGDAPELWTAAGVAWALKDVPVDSGQDQQLPAPSKESGPTKKKSNDLPAKNIILCGPPGTGKTHALINTYLPRFTDGDRGKRYEFVTFHQAYSYEDFIEGIKPVVRDDQQLRYSIEKGLFWNLAERARKDPDQDYAILIDEINRGNVASIFGELITLLEEDKRLGAKNQVLTTLPYSRDKFGVPKNLYVIGTMNTADRSVEALDAALRRRFHFEELVPTPSVLTEHQPAALDVDLARMLMAINERLERLLDRDHLIGHSYFMDLGHDGREPLEALKRAFNNSIIPLLREYFYGDLGKIISVLGKDFVREKSGQPKFLGDVSVVDDGELRPAYAFEDVMNLAPEAFRQIYEKTPDPGV